MPSLPVPLGQPILGGDLPVSTQADINAVLPYILVPDDPAPVRDAIFAALTQILLTYQVRATNAVDQSDVLTATGVYLSQACADLGVFRQPGESNDALRARTLLAPSLVTPAAILAAANSLLAPYTTILARYYETVGDRWYARSRNAAAFSTLAPRAYVYKRASIPQSPDYPDRLYQSEAASNGGFYCTGREPGAARAFKDRIGRYFVLRVPDISSINVQVQPVYQQTSYPGTATQNRFFLGTGTSATNTNFMRQTPATAATVYGQIINAINRIKGASIRWQFVSDPQLVS